MYRYLDANGVARRLADEQALAEAVRNGSVRPGTMLAEGESGGWQMAERHPAFQKLASLAPAPPSRGVGTGGLALGPLARLSPGLRIAVVAVLLLVVFGGLHTASGRQGDRLVRDYEEALLEAVAGRRPPSELLTDEPPDEPDAQLLWIRIRAEDEVLAGIEAALAAQGISGFDPPPAWLTREYFRNARSYPHVGAHWEAYNRFHATHAARIPDHIRGAVLRWSARAGLRPPFTNPLTDRIESEMGTRMRPFYIKSSIAGAALELHRALEVSEGRVIVREDMLEFEDLRTLNAYNDHLPDIRRRTQEMAVFTTGLSEEKEAMLSARPGRYVAPVGSRSDVPVLPQPRGARREGVPIRRPPRRRPPG